MRHFTHGGRRRHDKMPRRGSSEHEGLLGMEHCGNSVKKKLKMPKCGDTPHKLKDLLPFNSHFSHQLIH